MSNHEQSAIGASLAIARWRDRAQRAKHRLAECEALLSKERAERAETQTDLRNLYRAVQAFSDAKDQSLRKAGSPGIIGFVQAAYGLPFDEFAERWIELGRVAEGK